MVRSVIASLLVVFGVTCVSQAQPTNIVNICENAAYATGYVYTDQYVVSVNTDSIDQFESEVMWTELYSPQLQILFIPLPYHRGNYVFKQGVVQFLVKGDLNQRLGLQQRLTNLSVLSSVSVTCRYVL
ncbi:MAG: hypothetical protein KDD61_10670 [Bdellovibrionales bacterium]|nr:hypothetical protein [Bdellovibrionales bacterium]